MASGAEGMVGSLVQHFVQLVDDHLAGLGLARYGILTLHADIDALQNAC